MKSSKAISCLSKLLKSLDLFPTSNLIRYKDSSDYTTATGGFVSIIVIIVFIVLFASQGIKTVDRQIIQSSVTTEFEAQPPSLRIKTSPKSGYMFAISLPGFDLSNTTFRLFNITLYQSYYGFGFSQINSTRIPLQPCTKDHFAFGSSL